MRPREFPRSSHRAMDANILVAIDRMLLQKYTLFKVIQCRAAFVSKDEPNFN